MATSKKSKKPAKATKPKGRSRAMTDESQNYEQQQDEGEQNGEGEETQQEISPTLADNVFSPPLMEPVPLPPPHVSPMGSGAPPAVQGATQVGPPTSLGQEQQFVLLLAAIMYTRPSPHGVRDAYQNAKNLVQILRDDEAAAEKEKEPVPN